jgi:hypothetical protein
MNQVQGQFGETRPCVYCGKPVPVRAVRCPACREAVPEKLELRRKNGSDGGREIRRGLLLMLLALVIHYFAGGYSALQLPYPVNPIATIYLSPVLFFGGLALSFYGVYLRVRS